MEKGEIYIGTSGWSYDEWSDGVFYPSDISNKKWLEFYSQQFETVEINATFYHRMAAKIYRHWRQTTPHNFVFSVKISRFLTHVKKLNDPEEPWRRFIDNAKELKKKLGPILVQLPPNLRANPDKLKNLTRVIPKKYKIALEVRHRSWFCAEVYDMLKRRNWALVYSYGEGLPVEEERTAGWLYIRMHGPAGLYGSKYTTAQLKKLTAKIKKWRGGAKEIYVYFNNDTEGYAVENAKQLKNLVRGDMR